MHFWKVRSNSSIEPPITAFSRCGRHTLSYPKIPIAREVFE